jgi:uncharacterized cupin superfamily protein
LWTGGDGESCFEEGAIDFAPGARGDLSSATAGAVSISFQETKSGGAFAWHEAPTRQFVITLSGALDFETRKGEHFTIRAGDILFAEDTAGGGHRWRLVDEEPWRRVYVVLASGVSVPFVAKPSASSPEGALSDPRTSSAPSTT